VADGRRHTLAALAGQVHDLLIIGAGSVGAGIALQAAAAGLRVALVEGADFAAGTSSRSTKLIHGGVRYLERAVTHLDRVEYALVREALAERAAFFRVAPYLCRRIGLLTPVYRRWDRAYYGAGLVLYDLLSGSASLGRTRHLSARAARAAFAGLSSVGLRGGVLYFDGQFDDARMNVMLAVTARARGAAVLNHAEAVRLLHRDGRVAGAVVRDLLGEQEVEVRARAVVNAAGPFADGIRRLDDPAAPGLLTVSSGVHLVLRDGLCPPDTGLLVPRTPDGRVVFILPWQGRTLVGTTDRPAAVAWRPAVEEEDVAYLLEVVGRYLATPVRRSDVLASWSGLRPLVRDERRGSTAELARTHVVSESPSGLVSVVGGKWTTYRRIAADALAHLGRREGWPVAGTAWAAEVPILGSDGYSEAMADAVRRRHDLPAGLAVHLRERYGARMGDVAALVAAGHDGPVAAGYPYVEAEIVWAAREEMAETVMDVLARRLRLAFLDQGAARGSVGRVAAILARELGWDGARVAAEVREAEAQLATAL
jgi:glycerol-3-phosphate dehydrogenase